jgi:hypothetical protein
MDLGTNESGSAKRPTTSAKESSRKLKAFVLRKSGHTYCFCYDKQNELAAIRAAAECKSLESIDVLALACYLGHDPKELGLNA